MSRCQLQTIVKYSLRPPNWATTNLKHHGRKPGAGVIVEVVSSECSVASRFRAAKRVEADSQDCRCCNWFPSLLAANFMKSCLERDREGVHLQTTGFDQSMDARRRELRQRLRRYEIEMSKSTVS